MCNILITSKDYYKAYFNEFCLRYDNVLSIHFIINTDGHQ